MTSLHGGAAEEPMRLCDDDDVGSSGTVGGSGSSQQYTCPAGLALFPAIVIFTVSTVNRHTLPFETRVLLWET
jgi:hypothetical protein